MPTVLSHAAVPMAVGLGLGRTAISERLLAARGSRAGGSQCREWGGGSALGWVPFPQECRPARGGGYHSRT
jgi:hypothetical protein